MKTKEELRTKLLSQFDKSIVEKLTPHILAVVDESIESLLEGKILIDNRILETDEEILQVLNYGLVARLQVYQGVVDAAKKLSKDSTNVTINYRGTSINI